MPRPAKPHARADTSDRHYDADEAEFLKAMERFKREHKRPFPSWSDTLAVLKGLGWRKVQENGK